MSDQENTYDKYLSENDQFFYDEHGTGKGSFLKQDSELFNEEEYIPGDLVRVMRVVNSSTEDWIVTINGNDFLILKGTRFTSKEREYFRTVNGVQFILNGIRQGWKSVSEFKRQMKVL